MSILRYYIKSLIIEESITECYGDLDEIFGAHFGDHQPPFGAHFGVHFGVHLPLFGVQFRVHQKSTYLCCLFCRYLKVFFN